MIGAALALLLGVQEVGAVQPPPPTTAQMAAAAPVQSVNAMQGTVVVPGTVRQTCDISSFDSSGNGSCSLTAFTSAPDCFASLISGNASYVYSQPLVTVTTVSVSINMEAALKVLNISLGAATIWGQPPAGSAVRMICRGS